MINDIVGQKFGRLTVIEDSGKRRHRGTIWRCKCSCGNIHNVRHDRLKSGNTKSCGCLRKEKTSLKKFIHGDAKNRSRLYRIWENMKARCSRKKHHKYKNYGGRKIKVCSLWQKNYLSFKVWAISHGYQENLTIDRKDNDGNYKPENCQWITASENARKSNKILSEKILNK